MSKAVKITYWVVTIWLSLGVLSGGIFQLMRMEDAVANFVRLGYPVYVLTILGVWKILAVIAILIPKFPILKEWAYAGLFFLLSGALVSHIAVSDPFADTFPSVLTLVLTGVSWYLRPANRKVTTAL